MAAPSTDLKEKVRRLPHCPGVYLFKDRFGEILYVGKAKDLKKRVSTYFQPSRRFRIEQPKIAAMVELVRDLDTLEVRSDAEALLLEGKLIKEYKPRYNTDFTDDKRFLLVRVDVQNPIPRFQLVRTKKDNQSLYFGPFAYAKLLRTTLAEIQRKFGILLGGSRPGALRDGKFRLYDDARAEIYGHPNEMTPGDYRERVGQACEFLRGKSRQWLDELEAEMAAAAAELQFEKAAELRDLCQALRRTLAPTRKFKHNPRSHEDPAANLEALRDALGLAGPPRRMECFDISHISGSFLVASMVHFHDGAPDKARYRHFKIKSFIGNDDFRAMHEVVGRRYKRLHDEQKPFPDLVVIDGGIGQVHAALAAFEALGLPAPPLVGLAKKEESIVFPDGRDDLQLPRRDPALRLLQRLRDEAHRFANAFNAKLRSRRIRDSVLDDMPGLGPARREKLLGHFKSLPRLKKASFEELLAVKGIGRKFAEQLHEFLQKV